MCKKQVENQIKKIVEEIGYKPNLVAKGLAQKSINKKIGIILNAEYNPFYKDIIKGIEEKVREIADFSFEIMIKITKCYDIEMQDG